jgi:hypothetical protein
MTGYFNGRNTRKKVGWKFLPCNSDQAVPQANPDAGEKDPSADPARLVVVMKGRQRVAFLRWWQRDTVRHRGRAMHTRRRRS